ncbi:hypothetical protein C0992_004738 [Termitomyces sp. T32_za158]|nr:hypothetical protein C0992_004738 [Termitomyces sp. T32_za158]
MLRLLKSYKNEERRQEASVHRLRVLIQGVDFLSKLPYKLTSKEMADEHDTFIAEVPVISEKERKKLMKELTSFDGLKPRRASQLILAGCRSKDDLLCPKYFNMLNEIIQNNVRFASHLEKPVTRQQTEDVVDFIRYTLPKYEIIPVGSYRRESLTSSCVRILVIHPDMHHTAPPPVPPTGYLQPLPVETLKSVVSMRDAHLHNTIVPLLTFRGLAFAQRLARWWSWTGIFRVPKKVTGKGWETDRERLKGVKNGEGEFVLGRLIMLPSKSRGAAILYYTGSYGFIRRVKHKAVQLGLYFNHTGLWKWHPAPSEDILGKSFDSEPDIEEEDEDEGEGEESKSTKKRKVKKKPEKEGDEVDLKALAKGKKANGFWQMLPSTNEEVILEQLGIEYVAPEKRE